MRIRLQDRKTHEFFVADGHLTRDREAAADFASGIEAYLFAMKHRLKQVRVVCEFQDPRLNFKLPITDDNVLLLETDRLGSGADTNPRK